MGSVDSFEAERSRLRSLAYRMLGSMSEAEDVVQEAFLRWQGEDDAVIDNPAGFLTTVVTRLCLDVQKSARARREAYVGPWLPEPLMHDSPAPRDTESISLAFLVVLESLSPLERAAFLLAEVFDHTSAEIASILGRDEAACRQLVSRARAHVAARKPRFAPSREAHERVLMAFLTTCATGDVAGLSKILAADVTAWSDGGGRVRAALNPVVGPDHVSRFIVGVLRKGPQSFSVSLVDVNGWPAIVVRDGERVHSITDIETDGEVIFAVRSVLNPDKLRRVA
jgi:RNA polymerase sigma-70 factor (ECF subfamily)